MVTISCVCVMTVALFWSLRTYLSTVSCVCVMTVGLFWSLPTYLPTVSCVCVMTEAVFWSLRTWLYDAKELVYSRQKRSRSTVAYIIPSCWKKCCTTLPSPYVKRLLSYVNQMCIAITAESAYFVVYLSYIGVWVWANCANIYFTSLLYTHSAV